MLDIGAGSGTYSDLYSANHLKRPKFKWDAVEIWEPYVDKFKLHDKYDNVYQMDALSYLKTATTKYDVVFMGDVIEHMTKEEAVLMVELAQNMASLIIISVPIIHYPQGEYEGNPYEAHVKDDWSTDEMLATFPGIMSYGVEGEIGAFFIQGNTKHDVKKALEPRVAAYAIGKNEMKFAERFASSVMEADEVVICDTGSTDGTFEYLKTKFPWPNNKRFLTIEKISLQPFRFDDARNTALCLLRPDIDICVSLDFDEYMEPGWSDVLRSEVEKDLRERGRVYDRWNHRFKTVWNWEKSDAGLEEPNASEHWHERIHTRTGYLWKLPVHEVLVKTNGQEEIKWLGGFTMIQKPDTSKSRSSYLPMLEKSVKEDPTRWKTWSFLAGDLLGAGRHAEAFDAIEKAKKCHGADAAYLCNQKSRMHQQLGQIREAVAEMTNACMIAPHIREYKVYVARLLLGNNDREGALSMFRMAEAIQERSYGYEYDQSCWGNGFEELRKEICPR